MTDASQSPPVFGRLVFSSKNPCLLALHTAATVARISLNMFSEGKKLRGKDLIWIWECQFIVDRIGNPVLAEVKYHIQDYVQIPV